MRLFELTPKRREALGNYALNISVISFGVAAFEYDWWGIIPAIAGALMFFVITREK